jgi:putative FmdB family regulatory protein
MPVARPRAIASMLLSGREVPNTTLGPPDSLALRPAECQATAAILAEAMPIYEYRCEQGHTFEVMQRMSDDPVATCQTCAAPVERVFHPVAVHFKGSGFYTTDYGSRKRSRDAGEDSGKPPKKDEGSSKPSSETSSSTAASTSSD